MCQLCDWWGRRCRLFEVRVKPARKPCKRSTFNNLWDAKIPSWPRTDVRTPTWGDSLAKSVCVFGSCRKSELSGPEWTLCMNWQFVLMLNIPFAFHCQYEGKNRVLCRADVFSIVICIKCILGTSGKPCFKIKHCKLKLWRWICRTSCGLLL